MAETSKDWLELAETNRNWQKLAGTRRTMAQTRQKEPLTRKELI